MNYDDIEIYRRNKTIALDGIESWWANRLCRKALRMAARLSRRRVEVAFTDRLIEYPLLFQHLDLEPSRSHLLDFGCVEDLLPMHLCALGYRVTGLDFRPYPFRHERFDFIHADILSWEPPSDHFDSAISISTIEHVGLGAYGDPRASDGDKIAVAKLLRAVKPGGRLFLTVPAGRAVTTSRMRIYDAPRLRELIPNAEIVRFFAKRGRYADWNEIAPADLADIVCDDYDAVGAVQGVAFMMARKKQPSP